MRTNRIKRVTQTMATVCVIALAITTALGLVLIDRSKASLREQIDLRMLDIANAAARLLNGDELQALEATDEQTEPYRRAMDALASFHSSREVRYIYGIRKVGEGEYVFTVDPTVADPAAFGQPVQRTPALDRASEGTPAVDETPYQDDWGWFYSAYSPVFNSAGEVAGIVGVDFGAEWYDGQIAGFNRTATIIAVISLICMLAVLVLVLMVRHMYSVLNRDLDELAENVEKLAHEAKIPLSHGYRARQSAQDLRGAGGDVQRLSDKIVTVHRRLDEYVDYVQGKAYTDPITGAGNHAAYQKEVNRLSGKISTNMADFFIVVFDVNGLKTINDNLGHEVGDQLLKDAARILKEAFGTEKVFRIGGDEFIAVLEGADQAGVDALFERMDALLEAFNGGEKSYDRPLAISRGAAAYIRGKDRQYREIFKRADEAMYHDKAEYYRRTGEKRKTWEGC